MKNITASIVALSVAFGMAVSSCPAVFQVEAVTVAETGGDLAYSFDKPESTVTDGIYVFELFSGYASLKEAVPSDNGSITELTVPETVNGLPIVGIGADAFAECTSLRKLNLSRNISAFDWSELAEESIAEITVPEDSEYLMVSDGVLYTKDMKELLACPSKSGITEVVISDKTAEIAPYAFFCCKSLQKVVIPESLSIIGEAAFLGCDSLRSIALPEKLEKIEAFTFAGCPSLKELYIPEAVVSVSNDAFMGSGCIENENGIYYVDKWAVGCDSDIEEAYIRTGTVGTTDYLFSDAEKLSVLSVPYSCVHIGRYLAVGQAAPIERVDLCCPVVPDISLVVNAKEINIYNSDCIIADSENTFFPYWKEGDSKSSSKNVNSEKSDYSTMLSCRIEIGNRLASNLKKAVNAALLEIDDTFPFSRKYKYDTVICGLSGSTAEEYALKYRRCFEPFPAASANVGPEIYYQAETGLEFWIYDSSCAIAMISDNNMLKSEITVPREIKGVPVTGFRDNIQASFQKYKVYLPETIQSIGTGDIIENNIKYYEVSADNPYLCSVDGIVYNKEMTKLISIPSFYTSENIIIPDGIKIIAQGAGCFLANVKKLVLPDSIEMIREGAFMGSMQLVSVRMSENLDIIGPEAFFMCSALSDIAIPDSVNQIGYNAFTGTPAVEYENNCGYIGKWLVSGSGVEEAEIRKDTEGIATVFISGTVSIPATVTKMSWEMINLNSCDLERADVYCHTIGYDAFKNAYKMKDIYIYDPECVIKTGENTIPAKYIVKSRFDDSTASNGLPQISNITRSPMPGWLFRDDDVLDDVVIHGYKGSTAETYAELYNRKFVEITDEGRYINGDLSGDGELSVSDLVIMKKYLSGKYILTERQFKSADLNGDGKTDIFDLIRYRKALITQ